MKTALAALALLGSATVGTATAQDWRRDIPNGHLPPPGECRVWHYDRPAGHQPPPTSCRRAEAYADRYGGRVVYGSGDRHRRDDRWDRRDRDVDRDRDRDRVCVDWTRYGVCERWEWRH